MSDWKTREPDFGFKISNAGIGHWDNVRKIADEIDSFHYGRSMSRNGAEEYLKKSYSKKVLEAAQRGLGIVIEELPDNGVQYLLYIRHDDKGILVCDPRRTFVQSWLYRVLRGKPGIAIGVSAEEAITGKAPVTDVPPSPNSEKLDAKAIVKSALAFATRGIGMLTDEEFEEGIRAGIDLETVRLLRSAITPTTERPIESVAESVKRYSTKYHVGIDALRKQVDDVVARKRPRYNVGAVGDGYVFFKDNREMTIDDVLAELRRGAAAGERT